MWFSDWYSLGRILVASVVGYAAVLLFVRIAGKRSLSKMNAYDFVVNVALGSTLATLILSSRTPIVNGVVALASLLGLQFIVSWLALRSNKVHDLVKATPALVFFRGQMLHDTMKRERITEDEIRGAVRSQGLRGMDDVEAVVLETTGDLAVIAFGEGSDRAIADVPGVEKMLGASAVIARTAQT